MVKALQMKLPYILYYENLVHQYTSPENCLREQQDKLCQTWKYKFNNAIRADSESKLGVYQSINPDLKSPHFKNIPEFERITITRYRCGSHY